MGRRSKYGPLAGRKMREPCLSCAQGFILTACEACGGTGYTRLRCPQCWTWKPWQDFQGKKGLRKRCNACASIYGDWSSKSLAEREAATDPRRGLPSSGPLLVKLALESGNRKTGPIPVSMTSSSSCPSTCAFLGRGCYAEAHLVGIHWRALSKGDGMPWGDFCRMIAKLPRGQVWRHNEAGDLPGLDLDLEIDVQALGELVHANRGRRGFTYTHKPVLTSEFKAGAIGNRTAIRFANERGFTVNLSANNPRHADELADLNVGPVTTVLPHDYGRRGKTPAGRTIVVCPAEYNEAVTCATCQMCAVPTRKAIVGFRAHGDRKKQITTRMRQLPIVYENRVP